MDECSLKTHDCDANTICSNTVGSFTCKCDGSALYYGDGKTCSHHRKRAVTYFLLKLTNALMLILWVIYDALPLHFVTFTTLLSMLINEVVNIQRRYQKSTVVFESAWSWQNSSRTNCFPGFSPRRGPGNEVASHTVRKEDSWKVYCWEIPMVGWILRLVYKDTSKENLSSSNVGCWTANHHLNWNWGTAEQSSHYLP